MGARSPVRQRLVSILAALERHRPGDPRIPVLRTELATERLAEHIEATLGSWPPLTPAQRERLALLLNPGAGAHGT